MKTISLLLIVIILNISNIYPQGEAAIPSLSLNPSPELTGLGWTGVSIPNDDPFGFYYNPANLGYFSQKNNFSFNTYTTPAEWFKNFRARGIEYNNYAFNVGYNFQKEFNGLDISAGAGFIHSKFSFGTFYSSAGNSFESYDSYNAFGLGASINYYVSFSMGITFKSVFSKLSDNPVDDNFGEADVNAIDYGFLLTVPVTKFFDNNGFRLSDKAVLIPAFSYSLGYSRLNIGDEVYYIDPAQSDPIPLTARLGHTFSFGLDLGNEDFNLNLINYDLILEADDILIEKSFQTDSTVKTSYQGMLGDIDFVKHLIQLEGDDKVVVHKGHAINLLETIKILRGSFRGRGFMDGRFTDGLIISSRGMFKFIGYITGSETLRFIGDHFDIRYTESTLFADSQDAVDFSSISVSLINFPFYN